MPTKLPGPATPNTKPLVTAALLCEKVIAEADGVPTIIRVVDNYKITVVPELPPNIVPSIIVTAFFGLKPGDLRGEQEFTVTLRKPDGSLTEVPKTFKASFDAPEGGLNFTVTLGIAAQEGLYYLDLYWKGEVLASTPFKVLLGPVQIPDKT
ncbi:MAG: hypothetical protein ABSD56_02150 [Bryobacteraceae bacterium]|jgi:hypothetical protein